MNILAMIFPGQGSQSVGMLSELANKYSLVEETFSEASSILNYNLWNLIKQGPIEELNKTWIAQPAILTSSIAIWRIWLQQGGRMPQFMAGHSLGEYSALVCSGAINFFSAIKLVKLRGLLMQEVMPIGHGVMSVILGLEDDDVIALCRRESRGQVVSPSNFNYPGQVVISGHKEAVKRVNIACKQLGARVIPLSISVPSHCSLMKPVSDRLAQVLESIPFFMPCVPVVNNVDVRVEKDPIIIRQALIRQLYSPVRWAEIIRYLATQNVSLLLEIGPGKVLTSLTKYIVSSLFSLSANNTAILSKAITY